MSADGMCITILLRQNTRIPDLRKNLSPVTRCRRAEQEADTWRRLPRSRTPRRYRSRWKIRIETTSEVVYYCKQKANTVPTPLRFLAGAAERQTLQPVECMVT